MLIVLYLFLGGLSAGLLALSAAATLVGDDRYKHVAAIGAGLAPWPVLFGTAILVFDLGQPFYFWKLLVAVQPQSPMWVGTWLLTLFACVSLPFSVVSALHHLGTAPPALERWHKRLALAGGILAIGVGIYTGVLLGVLVARPLWNTPLLAQLFLASALSSGAAVMLLLCRTLGSALERRTLAIADGVLIATELVVLAWLFVSAVTSGAAARSAIAALSEGAIGWTFWIGVVLVGLVIPLFIEVREVTSAAHGRWFSRAVAMAPVLVLVGGFLLRLVFVYAGQSVGLS